MEREFQDIESEGRWHKFYMEIRSQSHECAYKVAKYPENRSRNRYRDVSPFDHSRVKLKNADNDYINASLVVMEEAQRRYILTQGPLRNTCGHFWLMIWEQKSKAIVMLNRVIEKGSEKCAQYWPVSGEREMAFKDTRFLVTLLSEDVKSYYTTRVLELQNMSTAEKREIHHFHYTTWPDFGVPESPASFLNFLLKVRESGALGGDHGPAVVHCSAGIGRSGTFSLVDTCLVLMEKRKDASALDIRRILLDMRKYRMGLIQTPDQLRFSFVAVLEGAKCIAGDASPQVKSLETSAIRAAKHSGGGGRRLLSPFRRLRGGSRPGRTRTPRATCRRAATAEERTVDMTARGRASRRNRTTAPHTNDAEATVSPSLQAKGPTIPTESGKGGTANHYNNNNKTRLSSTNWNAAKTSDS
ncbi:tyrosine-protein phosphatase non-receptor type 2 isoform X3 [Syngnathoides biaculeatus]|uniref:tyrosine-protein phosphatase non-receptor type 2 isoform X3 n=1 Tax=Syngnathoides biaculeatus TaxID=300417 RepID=UPI002ADD3283|nr:tyrosine-protein phosphatase non-receptor type 2 isoform X3 [Syngnathoides biaculeatus]